MIDIPVLTLVLHGRISRMISRENFGAEKKFRAEVVIVEEVMIKSSFLVG